MLDSVKTQIDYLEIIAANFIQTDNLVSYSNEKIVELNKSEKLVLKYNFLHVAISRNGGLIALCKQKDYFDQTKSRINNSIIILHQDATTRYFIPIDWDYSKRYIVNLEFNEKEQLFAFCSDGTIYKLDILTQKAIEIFGGLRIKPEGIHKAKLFEKGYIILTQEGTIYLVEDLKNPDPQFIISVKDQLGFTNDIDFIGIPARQTCSGKFEILITNQKGPGVLHVEKQEPKDRLSLNKEEDNRRSFVFEKRDFSFKGKVVHVSLMNSGYLEPYKVQMPNEILEGGYEVLENQLKSDFTLKRSSTKQTRIGNVTAMAISPTLENIALYVSDSKTVFYFSSQISVKEPNKIDKFRFELNPSTDNRELKIQEQILSFKTEQQLLFCGEENVAICGGKYIMMINNKSETIPILVDESEHNEYRGYIYCKCISEIDGIRYMTDKDIYLLSPVQKELNDLCNPFSGSLSRELINSYGNYISKNPFCHDQLKKIGDSLPDAIKDLAIAAANIYWTEKDPDSYSKRDVQNFMIKAAQFGKSIVQKEEFNFERFNDICKSIRIINNMRNYPLKPRYLTYNEYLDMNPDLPIGIINKTMRQLNFKLAHEICKFLGDDEKVVFLRYAIAKIKKLPSLNDPAEENYVYESLIEAFKNVENISYIEIAKKCIKYKKYDLAEKFLKNEKSVLVKIPQYLQLGKWNKALELSLKSCDLNVIKVVIDKIYKVEEPAVFNEIMASFPQAHSAVINYYKTIGKFDELNKYLDRLKDQEELLFISLENFFKSETLEEREKHLKDAKKSLSGLKTKDYGFYKAYISDLENSIKFKKQCFEQDKNIIETNDITTFDNSIYDCFQKAKADKYPWIETQNKKYFEISKRKMTILRFRNLLKVGNIEEVEAIIKKEGYKKLDISPLRIGRIFYEFRLNDKAVEYAKLETNPDLYDDKFNFLMNMEKYLDAVEAALSDKKNINTDYIYNVLRKKPDLKPKILELCEKYKVKI